MRVSSEPWLPKVRGVVLQFWPLSILAFGPSSFNEVFQLPGIVSSVPIWDICHSWEWQTSPCWSDLWILRVFSLQYSAPATWSQRLSFILCWQILRREPLLIYFFSWHEALRAEKRKPLVATVGNLTFMPAFDRRFSLEDIFNCSMSHMIGWNKYLWGWEWSVYVHLCGYVWRTFALSTDSLTREG